LYFVALVTELHFGRSIPDYKNGNNYKPRMIPNDFPTSVTLQYVHKNTIKTCKKPLRFLQPLDLWNFGSENPKNQGNSGKKSGKSGKSDLIGTPLNPIDNILEVLDLEPE